MGAEDGEVGIVALHLLEGVAVDHGQIVVIVLLTDKAAGILAEGTHLVFEGPGIAHQLGLIQHPVHRLHDLVADLHPDADIHGAGGMGNIVLRAELFQPICAPAAGGHHGVLCIDLHVHLAVGHGNALADVVFQNQIAALIAEVHLHAVFLKILLNGVVNTLCLFRTHVADGAVHQFQSRLNGVLADLLPLLVVAETLNVLVRTEVQIDLVGVVDGLLRQLRGDEGGQIAAYLIAEGQLAVRKRTGTGKAGGDVAVGLAVDALFRLVLGAVAVFHRLSLFHHDDFLFAALFDHFQRGENAGRACADDNNIRIHMFLTLLTFLIILPDGASGS